MGLVTNQQREAIKASYDEKEILLRIDRARWWSLMTPHVIFYGTLASQLGDIVTTSHGPTAATNGRSIFWNPLFVSQLDDAELRFVLLHEVLHVAHFHLWRLPRNKLGNMAGDYKINQILSRIEGCRMPKVGLLDARFDALAEEEVYSILKSEQQDGGGEGGDPGGEPGEGDGSGGGEGIEDPGGCGGFEEPDESQPEDQRDGRSDQDDGDEGEGDGKAQEAPERPGDTLRERWERALQQAEIMAKAAKRGNLPGDLQEQLDRARATRIDWKRETADFVKDVVSTRNDWTRAAKRHAHQVVIYPRKRQNQIGLIVPVRDVSGSIFGRPGLLAKFSATIDAALAETGAEALLFDVDTAPRAEVRIEPGGECPKAVHGGGGTDFTSLFLHVRELQENNGERIAGMIFLTDCMATYGDLVPDYPVLWLRFGSYKTDPPFGRVIDVADDE